MAPKKNQKRPADSTSDSDSGPDDMDSKQTAAKKNKTEKSSAASTKRQEDEDEPSWALDKKRFLKVREFKGKLMVDIREYYDAGGELKPGRKGISLSAQQWRKLVDIVQEVDEAIQNKA